MSVLVDTSVLIDVLRGDATAGKVLRDARMVGPVHASEVTRLEVLAGMRASEETPTRALLAVLQWHPLDERVAEVAGELGRRWLPGNRGIDSADLAIAATAMLLDASLLTRNVKHFPMFDGLTAPY
ncbi:type II toxin-antitoxin system VapC family toxin [Nocardioides sp. AE5]|uniref:type II toxin-antitoxin system VapC family toxin n=1 Tax=Nocardioides sp. AE5 TaxID=2962573 RepID=UPI0028819092|nr:type II toxin-antitoxin system VapC family toxin [Nocardioides sp. AE5]MDT0203498.1 type II toxin-antitoxin system VapC family toxin [Nocardioides sp. AE5]